MQHPGVSLIVGLGNPGSQYAGTRHNVGFWFLGLLQERYRFSLSAEKKYKAEIGSFVFQGRTIRVAAPQTFMNLSGQTVAPLANFYRIPPEQMLVIHDELDLEPGIAKLKVGGGHGGHNGLRDIVAKTGSKTFSRLRIGIGHPGHASAVSGYVLKRPPEVERNSIFHSLEDAERVMDHVIEGDFANAMLKLHTSN